MSDQTPHQLSDEELKSLTYKLQQKYDSEIAQKIIMHHRPAAFTAAGTVIRRHPHRKEDIRAAAMLGLVQGVKWVSQGRMYDLEITPYLVSCCYSAIGTFIEFDRVIRVPHSTRQLHGIGPRLLVDDSEDWIGVNVSLISQLGNEDGMTPSEIYSARETQPSTAEPEALTGELMTAICDTDQQKKVLELRLEGRTYDSIARTLHVTKGYIMKLIHKLRENYLYQKGIA